MTMKQFSKLTGMDYAEVQKAVQESEIHVRGRNVEYNSGNLRRVVLDYLKRKEQKEEHALAETRRAICGVHDIGEAWA